ncbi:CTD small phosphatase-like protein 2 isoform X1 [Populus alba x Populus x berolinensis]|uniref:CTD small phosphatase-like protein 2 isoform X1 n=1 Tax=Populus alba x Populus x berolinensis TaxID=444605 RepID=A0AAD6R9B3_9ROSI|nr:CTD small phosphatase-like protein 2 isoform X1 [Populus alba x Populus x berolinensis]
MQTKKRISGRNAPREPASPRISRAQKKLLENLQVAEKKVSELITSSARKQKCGTLPKKNEEPISATNSNTRYNNVHQKASNASTQCDVVDPKGCDEGSAQCVLQTIFSPSFHISKIAGGEISGGVDFIKLFRTGDSRVDMLDGHVTQETFKSSFEEHNESTLTSLNTCHSDMELEKNISAKNSYGDRCGDQVLSTDVTTVNSYSIAASNGVGLASDVSTIYLALKNSKLECVDEHGQDSMSTDVCLEEEEDYEDFDDFDPYLFIKNLPELSSVVPTFRPMLLPKQTRSCPPTTLVLDLDGCINCGVKKIERLWCTLPLNLVMMRTSHFLSTSTSRSTQSLSGAVLNLRDFMERVSSLFEIIIFTASQSIYAEQLLNVLDPKRRIFRHRVFRESCVFVDGNYLKDLSVLGRDLARVIIIDNSPSLEDEGQKAFGFQVDNGIPIESWFEDRSDKELLSLLPFLESLVGVEDVRPLIAKKYNLRQKIAAAVYPPLNSNRGDPFER